MWVRRTDLARTKRLLKWKTQQSSCFNLGCFVAGFPRTARQRILESKLFGGPDPSFLRICPGCIRCIIGTTTALTLLLLSLQIASSISFQGPGAVWLCWGYKPSEETRSNFTNLLTYSNIYIFFKNK